MTSNIAIRRKFEAVLLKVRFIIFRPSERPDALTMTMSYKPIPLEVSLHLRYLHQDGGCSGKELVKRYPQYSRTSIYRHMVKEIGDSECDKRHANCGAPRRLSLRDERNILRQIPLLRKTLRGSFSLNDIRNAADVPKDVSDSTLRRVIHRAGYRYRPSARKGVLSESDARARLKFARNASRTLDKDFWCEDICFYLDGTAFVYKRNPCLYALNSSNMTYRKKSERLGLSCTGRGTHEGTGGIVAKFIVCISYGKGITLCKHYTETLCGEFFAKFICKHFPKCFKECGNEKGGTFLQDGDPSQNSKLAFDALARVGAKKFSIPARSPDLNPIENVFNIIKRRLREVAIREKITQETYGEFVQRIEKTFANMPVKTIDATIESMPKRLEMVIKNKGRRIKY